MAQENAPGPSLISWNITRQCNLRCPHCYLDSNLTPAEGELLTGPALEIVEQIAQLSAGAMLVFSGGEPLMRRDLPALVQRASRRGLMPVLGTNGTLLDEPAVRELLACGLVGVGISLDSPAADYHDAFRGAKGAWGKAIAAMGACRRAGVPFQVQMSLARENLPQLEETVELSSRLGAAAFNLFFLVCTGRGERLTDVSPHQYDQALLALAQLQDRFPNMKLRGRCAPQFTRVLAERNTPEAALPVGCLAGVSYLRVTPEGKVTPCPYLPLVVGDLRRRNLTAVWKTSRVLNELRKDQWRGRCGICPFSTRCRGCRARAYATCGDYLGEDPWCTYLPLETHGPVPLAPLPWREEARQRMERAPGFIRTRVMAHIEAYARERGYSEVTLEVLEGARQGTAMSGSFAGRILRGRPPRPKPDG